jgi:hypothetical protein
VRRARGGDGARSDRCRTEGCFRVSFFKETRFFRVGRRGRGCAAVFFLSGKANRRASRPPNLVRGVRISLSLSVWIFRGAPLPVASRVSRLESLRGSPSNADGWKRVTSSRISQTPEPPTLGFHLRDSRTPRGQFISSRAASRSSHRARSSTVRQRRSTPEASPRVLCTNFVHRGVSRPAASLSDAST